MQHWRRALWHFAQNFADWSQQNHQAQLHYFAQSQKDWRIKVASEKHASVKGDSQTHWPSDINKAEPRKEDDLTYDKSTKAHQGKPDFVLVKGQRLLAQKRKFPACWNALDDEKISDKLRSIKVQNCDDARKSLFKSSYQEELFMRSLKKQWFWLTWKCNWFLFFLYISIELQKAIETAISN